MAAWEEASSGESSLRRRALPASRAGQNLKRVRTTMADKRDDCFDSRKGMATFIKLDIRNPRILFPVQNDYIRSAWVQRTRTKRAQEYEELFPYFSSIAADPPANSSLDAGRSEVITVATATNTTSASAPSVFSPIRARPITKPIGSSHMWVGTGSLNVAELCRAFRRLEPEKMFRAPRAEGEPIWAYWGGGDDEKRGLQQNPQQQGPSSLATKPRGSNDGGFILVPARDLAEVRTLEGALRHERSVLRAHCLLSFHKGEVSAHIPLEVTRMAIHDACDREMASALREYRSWATSAKNKLKQNTTTNSTITNTKCSNSGAKTSASFRPRPVNIFSSRRTSCQHAPHQQHQQQSLGKLAREAVTRKRISELQRMPPGWRPLRWVMMRQQEELRNQEREAEGMFREEAEQHFKERYSEAWERRHDYDLYCVLAVQFWPLQVDSFRGVNRPGKKLYLEIDAPARKITKMWNTCWPFRKDRKRRGCTAFQAVWRGYVVRRRWRPVVRLRVKHGRRACLSPCFASWRRLARVNKWARRRFDEMQGQWVRICYSTWREWVVDKIEEKQRKLLRAARTIKHIVAYKAFRSWHAYAVAAHRARRLFARVIGRPALGAWMQHTEQARERRIQGDAATTIQRHIRGYRERVRYVATRQIITALNLIVRARRDRRLLRSALVTGHRLAAEELLQAGRDAEIAGGLSREQRRLARLQKEIRAAEVSTRRVVTGGWKKTWFSTNARGGGAGAGVGELRREMKTVRAEWKALEEAGMGGERRTGSAISGGGGGRGGGVAVGFGILRSMTWGGLRKGNEIAERHASTASPPATTERGAQGVVSSDAPPGEETIGWSAIVSDDGERGGAGVSNGTKKMAAQTTNNTVGAAAANNSKTARSSTCPPAISSPKTYAAAVEREACRRIMSRELNLAREIATRNFDVRNPPPLKCCTPGCVRTFTQDTHYVAHWAGDGHRLKKQGCANGAVVGSKTESSIISTAPTSKEGDSLALGTSTAPVAVPSETGHPQLGGDEIALFHLAITVLSDEHKGGGCTDVDAAANGNGSGFEFVSAYIRRVWGFGQAYNSLLFWSAVESWRRRLTTEPAYQREAVALRQCYLDPGGPREATLPSGTRRALCWLLDTLPAMTEEDEDDGDDGDDFDGFVATSVGPEGDLLEKGKRDGGVTCGGGDVHNKVVVVDDESEETKIPMTSSTGDQTGEDVADLNPPVVPIAKFNTVLKSLTTIVDKSSNSNTNSNDNKGGPDHKSRLTKAYLPGREESEGSSKNGVTSKTSTTKGTTATTTLAVDDVVRALPPTSFDEAQWQALAHLCRVVGPGFWASDLGRRCTALRQQHLARRRDAANEIVRIERRERLASEASEVKAQLLRERDRKLCGLVEPVVEAAFEAVTKAAIRSAAARAEEMAIHELEDTRETEMISEAATVEAVWAIEPTLLESLLIQEIDDFYSEKEEVALMALEDNWIPPAERVKGFGSNQDENCLNCAMVVVTDYNSIPGGYEGAQAATETIQRAWRQRAARVEARRRLAKAYVKRPAPGGGVYYEDTVTGISQWERPWLASRLFPDSTW